MDKNNEKVTLTPKVKNKIKIDHKYIMTDYMLGQGNFAKVSKLLSSSGIHSK